MPANADLGHIVEAGMTTDNGLPAPHIREYRTRAGSAAVAPGFGC